MRRAVAVLGTAAMVLFATGLYAQSKDFAGKWTADAEKNAAANPNAAAGGGRGGGGGGDMTVTMDAKTMTIERAGRGGGAPTQTVYNLDGSDSKNTGMGRGGAPGAEQISNAKWDGATLVITTKTANGDQVAKYSMDGADLKIETTSPGRNGGEPMTRTQYYKKAM